MLNQLLLPELQVQPHEAQVPLDQIIGGGEGAGSGSGQSPPLQVAQRARLEIGGCARSPAVAPDRHQQQRGVRGHPEHHTEEVQPLGDRVAAPGGPGALPGRPDPDTHSEFSGNPVGSARSILRCTRPGRQTRAVDPLPSLISG